LRVVTDIITHTVPAVVQFPHRMCIIVKY